jgi:hypothetical protein
MPSLRWILKLKGAFVLWPITSKLVLMARREPRTVRRWTQSRSNYSGVSDLSAESRPRRNQSPRRRSA